MSNHAHPRRKGGKRDHHVSSTGRISYALLLNTAFTIIEIIGGIFTNSMAILSDALHDLGDTLALGLSWYLEKKSLQGRTNDYSYGYKRFSLLGAVTTSLILLSGSVIIIVNAIPRLIAPEETHSLGMMGFALVGILANGLAYFRLTGGKTLNEKAVKLHLLEDVLGWVSVLIGSIVIYFTDWFIIDPILSIGIAAYILLNTFKNLSKAVKVFLQGVPEELNIDKVGENLSNVEGVLSFHDLHVWSMDGIKNVLTVHLVIADHLEHKRYDIKAEARSHMAELGIQHCTFEIELEREPCGMLGHAD